MVDQISVFLLGSPATLVRGCLFNCQRQLLYLPEPVSSASDLARMTPHCLASGASSLLGMASHRSRIGGQDSGDQSAASSGHHSPRLRSRICREVAAKYANWRAVVLAPPPSNLPSSDPTHAE